MDALGDLITLLIFLVVMAVSLLNALRQRREVQEGGEEPAAERADWAETETAEYEEEEPEPWRPPQAEPVRPVEEPAARPAWREAPELAAPPPRAVSRQEVPAAERRPRFVQQVRPVVDRSLAIQLPPPPAARRRPLVFSRDPVVNGVIYSIVLQRPRPGPPISPWLRT